MSEHLIAVSTYGAQRVTSPQTGKTISAYKMGYTSAVTAVLLALYCTHARDVSPKQASYRYIQIEAKVVVRHGHILLTISDTELAQAEQISRRSHRAGVYLWRDKRWWAFPDSSQAGYSEPTYQTAPTFDPTGFRPPSPSTGERKTTLTGIQVEKNQRSPSEKPWWWLLGDTYSQRETLKRWGARFSNRRKAWYYIGWELPDGLKALISSVTATAEPAIDDEDAPCSDAEAEAILGVPLQPKAANSPPRLFHLGQLATPATTSKRQTVSPLRYETD